MVKAYEPLQCTLHVLILQGVNEEIEAWDHCGVKEYDKPSLANGGTAACLQIHADNSIIEYGHRTEMRSTGIGCIYLPCFWLHFHHSFANEAIGNKNNIQGLRTMIIPKTKTDLSTAEVSTQAILTIAGNSHRNWSRRFFTCSHIQDECAQYFRIDQANNPDHHNHPETQMWAHYYQAMQECRQLWIGHTTWQPGQGTQPSPATCTNSAEWCSLHSWWSSRVPTVSLASEGQH